MRRKLKKKILILLLLALLVLTGCGGRESGALVGDPLYESAHSNINIGEWATNPFWVSIVGLVTSIAIVIALWNLFRDDASAWKWIILMILFGTWFVLGDSIQQGVRGSWPTELNQSLIDSTVGDTGLLGGGDKSPWSTPFIEPTITIVTAMLAALDALAALGWMVVSIAFLVDNIRSGRTMSWAALGTWIGLQVSLVIVPEVLLTLTKSVQSNRSNLSVPGINEVPILGQAVDNAVNSALNTVNQVNLRFIIYWLIGPIGAVIFTMLAFASISFFVSRKIGEISYNGLKVGNKVYSEVRKAGDNFAAETKNIVEEGKEGLADLTMPQDDIRRQIRNGEALVITGSPIPGGYTEKDGLIMPDKVARNMANKEAGGHKGKKKGAKKFARPDSGKAKTLPQDHEEARLFVCECGNGFWNSVKSGDQVNCPNCGSTIPAEEGIETEEEVRIRRRQKFIRRVETTTEAATVVATATGHPEIGAVIGATTAGLKKLRDQDPDQSQTENSADKAMQDFLED